MSFSARVLVALGLDRPIEDLGFGVDGSPR